MNVGQNSRFVLFKWNESKIEMNVYKEDNKSKKNCKSSWSKRYFLVGLARESAQSYAFCECVVCVCVCEADVNEDMRNEWISVVDCRNAMHSIVTVCYFFAIARERLLSYHWNCEQWNEQHQIAATTTKSTVQPAKCVRKTTLFMCVNWHHRNLDMSEVVVTTILNLSNWIPSSQFANHRFRSDFLVNKDEPTEMWPKNKELYPLFTTFNEWI